MTTAPSGERSSRRPLGRRRDEGCRRRRTPIRQVGGSRPVLLALAITVLSCTLGAGRPDSFQPTFTRVNCPVEITSIVLVDVSCGRLTVLAHHAAPDRGTIDLFVVRMEPGDRASAPDPVLYVGGDLGVAPDYTTLGAQVRGLGREVIVLEGRGTGHSEPSLLCPGFDALPASPVASPVDDPQTRKEFLDAIAECRNRLTSNGVDLIRVRPPGDGGRCRGYANRAGDRPVERDDARDGVTDRTRIHT